MRNLTLNLLFAASLAVGSSFGANIVSNGDFSTGQFGPWTHNTGVGYAWTVNSSATASTGCVGAACVDQNQLTTANYLYQDLATTPGGTYDLSFNYASGGGTPSDLKVLWGSDVILDLENAPNAMMGYSVSNLIASSVSTRLMFLGRQDPSFLALTNVDVERSSAAPEPASVGLIAGGIGLVGFLKRMRNARQAR